MARETNRYGVVNVLLIGTIWDGGLGSWTISVLCEDRLSCLHEVSSMCAAFKETGSRIHSRLQQRDESGTRALGRIPVQRGSRFLGC